jgi:uncharacterized protein YpbB
MQHLIKSELRRRKHEKYVKNLEAQLTDYFKKLTAKLKPRPILQDEIEEPNENELFCFELKNRKQ